MKLISKSLVLSLSLGLILTACTSNSSTSVKLEDLQTPRWILTSIDDKDLKLKKNQKAPSINVDEVSMASGFSGCNHYFAELHMRNGRIKMSNMNSTMKLCMKPQNDLETLITQSLTGWSKVSIDEGIMTLANKDHKLVFHAKRK
jgi:heat shock protein HslJ